MKNTEKQTINLLSRRVNKKNKVRNTVLIGIISLLSFLFTVTLVLCFSMAKNVETSLIRSHGTAETDMLSNPTEEQINIIKELNSVETAGIKINAGEVSDDINSLSGALFYYDEAEYKKHFMPAISDVQGTYPETEEEIMLSSEALKKLHMEQAKIGDTITIEKEGETYHFRLCGRFVAYADWEYPYDFVGLVSKAYCDKQKVSVQKNGYVCVSPVKGYLDLMRIQIATKVMDASGNQGWESYENETLQSGYYTNLSLVITIVIAAVLAVCGFFLIYNVMSTSLEKDIKLYGLLKTIGMSEKQIYKMLLRQACSMSVCGLAIGMGLGTIVSKGLAPNYLQMFGEGNGTMPTTIYWHPLIYIGTIAFILLTVIVSFQKAAKLAARISPVEAAKFSGIWKNKSLFRGSSLHCATTQSQSSNGGKLHIFAFRNVIREKKKACLVVGSLFLAFALFLGVQAFTGCLKAEQYVENDSDYTLQIYSENDQKEKMTELTAKEKEVAKKSVDLQKKLKNADGLGNVKVYRYRFGALEFHEEIYAPFLERDIQSDEQRTFEMKRLKAEGGVETLIVFADENWAREYSKNAGEKFDVKAFLRGETCVIGYTNTEEQAKALCGKKICIYNSEEGTQKQMTIGMGLSAASSLEYMEKLDISVKCVGAPEFILVSENVAKELYDDMMVSTITADCESGVNEETVTNTVKNLAKESGVVDKIVVKKEKEQKMENTITMLKSLGSVFCFSLMLVGITNLCSVFVVSMDSRKKEFALLESVGMTKGQIKKMLFFEGCYYAGSLWLLLLTIGNFVIFSVMNVAVGMSGYGVISYPFLSMGAVLVLIATVSVFVPIFIYEKREKETVVERLRMG